LAGKYLKARQLAKEIEKKAKKTAEKKKKAKEGLEQAEELLDTSEDLGIDISEVDGIIKDAREDFEDKKFEESSKKINQCLDGLQEIYSEKLDEMIEDIKDLHDYLDLEIEETDYEEMLNEANKLFDQGKYKESIIKTDEIFTYVKKDVEELYEDWLYEIESKIETLRTLNGDINKFEQSISSAEDLLDEFEIEKGKQALDSLEDEINRELKNIVTGKIEEIEKIEELLRKNGISTKDVEETISEIKAKNKKNEYAEIVNLFGKIERELSDRKDELVSKMVKKLRDEIEKARELGAPQSKIKSINEKINELQEIENFGNIINLIDELFEKVEEAKFHKVLKTIAESRENFIKAKEIGIDITEPMDILNKARTSLKEGNHREALDWAKKGRKKVRDMVKEHEKTENELEKIKEITEGLNEFELDLSFVDDRIEKAEEYLEQKEYSKSREILEEIESDIDEKAYEKIMEFVEEFEVNILTLERMGLDSGEYTEMLEEAIANTKTMDYIEAGKIALKGKNQILEKIKKEIDFKIETVSRLADNIKESIDSEDIEDELKNVENLIDKALKEKDKSNYKTSYDKLQEAEETVNEWQVGEADQKYNEAKETLELVEDIDFEGIDIDDYLTRLEDAKLDIEGKNYPEAIQKIDEILDDLNVKLKKKSEEFFTNAKVEVVKAKKSGVDINKMREELIECKKNIKQENFTKAISLSVNVEKRAKKVIGERSETKKLISDLNETVRKLRESDDLQNLKPAIKLLKEAKSSFQQRNYVESKELANKTKMKLDELKMKNEFETYHDNYKKLLKRADIISVDTEDIQDEVNTILNKADGNDYSSAIEMIQEINDELLNKIKDSVEPRINHTQEIIESAKEIGIDISSQEVLLSKAKENFENNEFKAAVEKINECQNEIQEIRDQSKKAARSVKKAKNRLEEAMDIHADISTARKELQVSMEAIKNDEYEKAIDTAEKALSSIRLAERNRVEKILSTFKEKINEMRVDGVNTSFADNLIARAEKAKKNENYKEAINLAMQSEGELERIELQQDIAKRSISTTTNKLSKAKNEGMNIEKPEKILKEAKKAYDGGFYVKAFDKAVKAGEILNNIIKAYTESKSILDDIEQVLDKLKVLGMEEIELMDKYSKAVDAFENDNYEKSYSLANRAKETLSNVKKELPDQISDMEDVIDDLKSKGDVGKSEKLLNKAKANLKMGNILEVFDLLAKAKEEYGGKYFEEYEQFIGEASKLVKKANKFGTDVSEAKEIINEARGLRDENIKKASLRAKEALVEIEKILAPYSPNIEVEMNDKLRLDTWNKVNMSVKNTGGGVAKSPSIKIKGAKNKDIELPSMLKANESFETETKIKPTEDKVIIEGVGTRIFDNKDISYQLEIEVTESNFKIIDATGNEKCGICKGEIKKGLDVIICDCESPYHKLCGERKGECPECGLDFTLDEEEKKEEKGGKKASKRVALRI